MHGLCHWRGPGTVANLGAWPAAPDSPAVPVTNTKISCQRSSVWTMQLCSSVSDRLAHNVVSAQHQSIKLAFTSTLIIAGRIPSTVFHSLGSGSLTGLHGLTSKSFSAFWRWHFSCASSSASLAASASASSRLWYGPSAQP